MRVTRACLGIAATLLALVGGIFASRAANASMQGGNPGAMIRLLNGGPFTRFRYWVDPPVVMGAMCIPMPNPLPNEADLPPEAPTGEEGE